MLFKLATLVASFAALAHARIDGIAVPETVGQNDTFTVTLLTENYIQTVEDVGYAVGYSPGAGHPGSNGQFMASYFIGHKGSNSRTNITASVRLPENTQQGEGLVLVSLLSLYGVSSEPIVNTWNVSVTVGDTTSSTLKLSQF